MPATHRLRPLALCLCSFLLSACAVPAAPRAKIDDTVQYYLLPFGDPESRAALVRQFLPVRASYEPRTRLIILRGIPADVQSAVELLNHLNLDFEDGPNAFRSRFSRHLEHARVRDVEAVLQSLIDHQAFHAIPPDPNEYPPVVADDEKTNVLFVECPREFENTFDDLINELDAPITPTTEPSR